MSFEDVQDQAGADILDVMGVDAVYQPSVVDPVSVKLFKVSGVDLQPADFDVQVWEKGITLEGLVSVFGKEPDKGETITIGSDVFTVKAVSETDGRFVKVIVT